MNAETEVAFERLVAEIPVKLKRKAEFNAKNLGLSLKAYVIQALQRANEDTEQTMVQGLTKAS